MISIWEGPKMATYDHIDILAAVWISIEALEIGNLGWSGRLAYKKLRPWLVGYETLGTLPAGKLIELRCGKATSEIRVANNG